MADGPAANSVDLRRLLSIAENTSPVDAIDVVAGELRRSVGGRHVSLLITNFSGTGLVRLSHVGDGDDAEDGQNERAEAVTLAGSPYESTMFSQTPGVVASSSGWLVLAPITERGDAIGLLEVSLPAEPDDATV